VLFDQQYRIWLPEVKNRQHDSTRT